MSNRIATLAKDRIKPNEIRSLKHARQAHADVTALLAAYKAEAIGIADIPEPRRTQAQSERLAELDAEMPKLANEAAETALKVSEYERHRDEQIASVPKNVQPVAGGRRYVEMFGGDLSTDGWRSADEFLSVIHAGLNDQRLRAVTSMYAATGTVGVPSDGGFSVPSEFAKQWLDVSLENEIVRSRATVWPMISDTRKVPGWDAMSSASSTLYGAFTAQWIDEAGEITAQAPKMRLIELKARKLALLAQISNELVADGMGYEPQLSKAIVNACGWYMDDAFLNGGGASKPLGVMNAPCLITVSKETGQAAGTIVYANVANMFARVHPGCLNNSVWVASTTTIPQLLQLSLPLGTSGSHVRVLNEEDGKFTMLGRPVIFTEKVPAIGTVGDLGLYDFSQYAIGLRKDMSIDKSQHVGFTRDTSYYRAIVRVDGMAMWPSVYTPKNGSTLAPFVVLATRS